MEQIAVIATEREYAEFLRDNIAASLEKYGVFVAYSLGEAEGLEYLEEKVVLVSAFNIFQRVKQKIKRNSEIIVLSTALNKQKADCLKDIPKGTRALLVNFDNRSCMHIITRLYAAGFRDLELFPYFGEGEYDENIHIAITPNEAHLVPKGIEKIIDIGESLIDMSSLYDIADKLGVTEAFASREALELAACGKYYFTNSSMEKTLGENKSLMEKLNILIKLMNQGIIITDVVGRIYLTNEKAERLLESRSEVLTGVNVEEIIPEISITLGNVRGKTQQLIWGKGENIILSTVEIKVDGETTGYIFTLVDFEEIEEQQHGIRSRISGVNHIAKYAFDDIKGGSKAIKNAIEAARRMARTEASVMIIGESGTGKEMFAQSIHNESERKRYNFVAVNCAAIPENLLESEMFGYEEGSFTGAKKGGKIGYFELAHKGTIFLDEIAEMPLQLQSKLLRVLEEKKIMRVGSNRNIDVDVRIIAATNKDLYCMVLEGKFREDLYYRINVLPLDIPPLRERREDIGELIDCFVEQQGLYMNICKEAKEVLYNSSWRGNIRELRNAVEYMASFEKEDIKEADLPRFLYMTEEKNLNSMSPNVGKDKGKGSPFVKKFILSEGSDIDMYILVLEELESLFKDNRRIGRRRLQERICQAGGLYTEAEIRKALMKLEQYGFVRAAKGRGGTILTPEGVKLRMKIEEINKLLG